jgi:Holliday junction resolvase RusA-like endonuclease
MIELNILGELCSKSNSRRIVQYGGHPRIIKSQKALDYEYSSTQQIQKQLGSFRTLEGPICLEFHVYYASRRPDLDISLIQDTLEHNGIYKNDRQVVEIHAFKYLDKKNPRVIARIHEVDENPMT